MINYGIEKSEMFERFPFIRREDDGFSSDCWLDDMPEGWASSFGIDMCEEIKQALVEENLLDSYSIIQIKEKFGELRWYDNVSFPKINNIIEKYRQKSIRTCIKCGKPAVKVSLDWISPWCADCAPHSNHFISIEEYLNG